MNDKNSDDASPEAVSPERATFFLQLYERAGLRGELAENLSREAARDPSVVEQMIDSLIRSGTYQPRGESCNPLSPEDLAGLSFPRDARNALERQRLAAEESEHWFRLGQLFGILGETERAALCYRSGYGLMIDATPEFLVSLAESIDVTRNKPLALGCIDRVAEIILTGDQALDSPDRRDVTAEDPSGCAMILDRAREAALRADEPGRAASLARAATALFERCGLRFRLQSALQGLAQALIAMDEIDAAIKALERRRVILGIESDYLEVGGCYRQLAELAERAGKRARAALYREHEIQVYESIVELAAVAEAARGLGDFHLRHGELDEAIDAYEQARESSLELPIERGRSQLALAEAWLIAGRWSTAAAELRDCVAAFRAAGEDGAAVVPLRRLVLVKAILGRADDSEGHLSEAREADAEDAALQIPELFLALERGEVKAAAPRLESLGRELNSTGEKVELARALLHAGHRAWLDDAAPELLPALASAARVLLGGDHVGLVDEVQSRLHVLIARAEDDGEALLEAFDNAAASDYLLLRIEAAEALARSSLARGDMEPMTRSLSSALRCLEQVLGLIEAEDREAFGDSVLARGLIALAAQARERLREESANNAFDGEDATTRLNPALVLDGVLTALAAAVPAAAALVAPSGLPTESESHEVAEASEASEATDASD